MPEKQIAVAMPESLFKGLRVMAEREFTTKVMIARRYIAEGLSADGIDPHTGEKRDEQGEAGRGS